VLIRRLQARTKEQTNAALRQAIEQFGRRAKTITLDNGTEFDGQEAVESWKSDDDVCSFATRRVRSFSP
jgi:IS30 family transposase